MEVHAVYCFVIPEQRKHGVAWTGVDADLDLESVEVLVATSGDPQPYRGRGDGSPRLELLPAGSIVVSRKPPAGWNNHDPPARLPSLQLAES